MNLKLDLWYPRAPKNVNLKLVEGVRGPPKSERKIGPGGPGGPKKCELEIGCEVQGNPKCERESGSGGPGGPPTLNLKLDVGGEDSLQI